LVIIPLSSAKIKPFFHFFTIYFSTSILVFRLLI